MKTQPNHETVEIQVGTILEIDFVCLIVMAIRIIDIYLSFYLENEHI